MKNKVKIILTSGSGGAGCVSLGKRNLFLEVDPMGEMEEMGEM